MTIAAAFKFDGGILFCADTKITTDVQTHERKIIERQYENGYTTMFAFAGAVSYARMLVRRCEEALAQLDATSASLARAEAAIESSLVEFYQTHLYPHPDRLTD